MSQSERVYTVVQWATGGVGKQAIRAILANPFLELVGGYVYSSEKVGKDLGEIAGCGRAGVAATQDVDALLALKPDVVSYNGLWSNVDDFCRILESGINIVTSSAFVTGHALGEGARQRIQKAGEKGNTSIFGTGIHPGYSSYISLVAAGICGEIERISLTEAVDCTGYASRETWESCGFGMPIDHPDLHSVIENGTRVFSDGIYLAEEALGIKFDEVRYDAVFSAAIKDCDFGFMKIAKGCVAGVDAGWRGYLNGKSVVELNQKWKMGDTLEPDIQLMDGYVVEVKGRPNVNFTLKHSPPSNFTGTTAVDLMDMNLTTTALPAINAIPHVVAAKPGIRTYVDLPLITGRGFVFV